jgi:hypothetical protein
MDRPRSRMMPTREGGNLGWRIARHVAAWWPDAPHFETHSATLPVSSELLELTHAGANKEKWGSLAAIATAAISTLTGDPLAANPRPLLAFSAFMPNDCPYLIVEASRNREFAVAGRRSLRTIRCAPFAPRIDSTCSLARAASVPLSAA